MRIEPKRQPRWQGLAVHYSQPPHRKSAHPSQAREHPMQVFADQVSKAFRAARTESGFHAGTAAPPPFYEIKSLGGDRYRSMGWSEATIQALYGHEDRDMIAHYLAGHEAPWQDVTES